MLPLASTSSNALWILPGDVRANIYEQQQGTHGCFTQALDAYISAGRVAFGTRTTARHKKSTRLLRKPLTGRGGENVISVLFKRLL
jgi:hypothetical protein